MKKCGRRNEFRGGKREREEKDYCMRIQASTVEFLYQTWDLGRPLMEFILLLEIRCCGD
jgi:hypothetical protein